MLLGRLTLSPINAAMSFFLLLKSQSTTRIRQPYSKIISSWLVVFAHFSFYLSTSHREYNISRSLGCPPRDLQHKIKGLNLAIVQQIVKLQEDNLFTDKYVAQLTQMAKELHDVGTTIDDGDLFLITLNGLNRDYNSFITLHIAQANGLNFSKFLGIFHAYKSRLQRSAKSQTFATTNIVESSDLGQNFCQICTKRGYTAIQCFNMHNE